MASPFKLFRKYQKGAFLTFGIGAILSFIIIPVWMQVMNVRPVKSVYFAKSRYGNVDTEHLSQLQQRNQALASFYQNLNRIVYDGTGESFPVIQNNIQNFSQKNDDKLIEEWLITKDMHEKGFSFSEQDVLNYYKRITNDKINDEIYKKVLDSTEITHQGIIALVADQLLVEALYSISGTLPLYENHVTPVEQFDWFNRCTRTMKMQATSVNVDDFIDEVGEPSKKELKKFFEENKFRLNDPNAAEPGFAIPKLVSVERAELTDAMIDASTVTDEEALEYYEANKNIYRNPYYLPPEQVLPTPNLSGNPVTGTIGGIIPKPTTPSSLSSVFPSVTGGGETVTPEVPVVTQPLLTEPTKETEPTTETVSPEQPVNEQPAPTETSQMQYVSLYHTVAYQTEEKPEASVAETPTTEVPSAGTAEVAVNEVPPTTPAVETTVTEPVAIAITELAIAPPVLESPANDSPAVDTNKAIETPSTTETSTTETSATETSATETSATEIPIAETQATNANTPELPSVTSFPAVGEIPNIDFGGGGLNIFQSEFLPFEEVKEDARKQVARKRRIDDLDKIRKVLEEYGDQFTLYTQKLSVDKKTPKPVRPNVEQLAKQYGFNYVIMSRINQNDFIQNHFEFAIAGLNTNQNVISLLYAESGLIPELPYRAEGRDKTVYIFWVTDKVEEPRIPEYDEEGIAELVQHRWKQIKARELAEKKVLELAEVARKSNKPLSECFAPSPSLDKKIRETVGTEYFSMYDTNSGSIGEIRETNVLQGEAFIKNKVLKNCGMEFYETVYSLNTGEVGTAFNYSKDTYYVVQMQELLPVDDALYGAYKSSEQGSQISTWMANRNHFNSLREGYLNDVMQKTRFEWIVKPSEYREQQRFEARKEDESSSRSARSTGKIPSSIKSPTGIPRF